MTRNTLFGFSALLGTLGVLLLISGIALQNKDVRNHVRETYRQYSADGGNGRYECSGSPKTVADDIADYHAPDAHPLRDVAVGSSFTISRIPEELEFEPGMLDFLEQHSLQPGHTGVLTVLSPDGTATVEVEGAHVGVPAYATERILVTA